MKALVVLALVLSSITGCATLGTATDGQNSGSSVTAATSSVSEPVAPFPAQQPSLGPQVILPVTGGAPIFGIPLGGNLYLPVTGGPPEFGTPLAP